MYFLGKPEIKSVIFHFFTIMFLFFSLINIFVIFNPELSQIVKDKEIGKLDKYAFHFLYLQLSSFFLSGVILAFIRRNKNYINGIIAVVLSLTPAILTAFNYFTIIILFASVLIISFGTWLGYSLRPPKEDKQ